MKKKKKKKNESLLYDTCDFCGKTSDDVAYQINPYKQDINGDCSKYYMCSDCVDDSTMDI